MNDSALGKAQRGLPKTTLGDKFKDSAMVSTLPPQGWVSSVMGVHVALVFCGLYQDVGSIVLSRPIQRWADGREQQVSGDMISEATPHRLLCGQGSILF